MVTHAHPEVSLLLWLLGKSQQAHMDTHFIGDVCVEQIQKSNIKVFSR